MAVRSLTERVEILEQKVGDLQELPGRMANVESQILQLRGEMRDGFSAIHARLGAHDGQFESIDQRFVSIDQRFASIDQRFISIDQRFDAMDRRFDAMDRRFDTMDQRFDAMDRRFDTMDQRFDTIDQRFDTIMHGLADLKTHMLVLHEEALRRIAVTREAPNTEGRKRKKR